MALGLRSTRCRINIRNKNSKLTVFRDQTKICRSSSLDHLTVLSSLFPLFLLILWSFFRPLWLQAQIRNKISMCPSRAQTEFSCYAANQRSTKCRFRGDLALFRSRAGNLFILAIRPMAQFAPTSCITALLFGIPD